jgi:transposase
LFVDAVLCRYRAGVPWRDLPDRLGNFRGVHLRHMRLAAEQAALSTKIHATVDALGHSTGFQLTPGQASDLDGADVLLKDLQAQTVMLDRGATMGNAPQPAI